jgi:RNA polymerase sigma-70 factor (ECF subfamily)
VEQAEAQDLRAVGAVLGGDPEAFGELVRRHQRLVAGIAWRYGTRREEIEDMVSEVFTKAYRNLGRYRPEHPFSTWLYRLAANHVMDHGRRARRAGPRVELPESLPDPACGPEEDAARNERARRVRRALAGLKSHYRETLFLVYVEGCGVEETARALGVPVGTVKSRLLRGRLALREALADSGRDV